MLRSAIELTLRRPAPAPRFYGSSGCSQTATRKMSSDGTDYGSWTADNIKRAIESFYENWKGPELLFGCIALTMMVTYKYNVTGKGIMGYRFDEARKEREAREQREEARKNNIDISLC